MPAKDVAFGIARRACRQTRTNVSATHRHASTSVATKDLAELEPSSSFSSSSQEAPVSYDPTAQARARKDKLPASR